MIAHIGALASKTCMNRRIELGIFVNPFYIARRALADSIRRFAPDFSGSVIDVGCGGRPYEKFFTNATSYTGMEFDSPTGRERSRADVFYDGSRFPFPDGHFDGALATEVLEHVFTPDQFLKEIHRVLKPGGKLLLTAPFAWDEHEQPYDYARYSSFGIRHLLENHGFRIQKSVKTAADARIIFQLAGGYVYKKIPFKRYRVRLLCYLIFIMPLTVLGLFFGWLLPRSEDLYLGNVVLAEKI